MGNCFLYGNGGGGAALNFAFATYATQAALEAATPSKNNTIGLVTSTAVGDYQFAATQPTTKSDGTALAAGDVWIKTGSSSPVEFNALAENGIVVYPLMAYQYSGSAWASVTAKSYQSGAWVDWYVYSYNYGAETDAWQQAYNNNSTFTKQSTYMYFYTVSDYGSVYASTAAKIDVTNFNKMYVYAQVQTGNTSTEMGLFAGLSSSNSDNSFVISGRITPANTTVTQLLEIDISAYSGYYYPKVGIKTVNSNLVTANVYRIYFQQLNSEA